MVVSEASQVQVKAHVKATGSAVPSRQAPRYVQCRLAASRYTCG